MTRIIDKRKSSIMQNKNTGTCLLCNQQVEHRTALKHVKKCIEANTTHVASEKEKIFHFKITDGKLFWLYIEINGSSKLDILDSFLRNIWLECCGHMSDFEIDGVSYSSDGEMNKVIHRL